jgi:hypothetical protein
VIRSRSFPSRLKTRTRAAACCAGLALLLAGLAAPAAQAEFGVAGFDVALTGNPEGDPFTQAAGQPFAITTTMDFNSRTDPLYSPDDPWWPEEPTKDVLVDLPPGFVGNPTAAAKCTVAELSPTPVPGGSPNSICPTSSQVGTAFVRTQFPISFFVPIYNMVPGAGVPGRFAFNFAGTIVGLDAKVRSGGDYGLTIGSANISEGLAIRGSTVSFWGVPADPLHTPERHCPGTEEPCPSDAPEPLPLLRNATSCPAPGVGRKTSLRIDSWPHPGNFVEDSFESEPPTGCDAVPFEAGIAVAPTTTAADSPTGLEVDLTVPQDSLEEVDALAPSDLKKAVITLPAGMSVNPSSADGLGACSSAQIGLLGTNFPAPAPIHFTPDPGNCPDNSKIGSLSIQTPLLDHAVNGSVYLAAQKDNPFGSLLAMYLVADDPISGTVVKLAGHVQAGPGGQLTATFDNQPQLPFSALHVSLFPGTRAPLMTPPHCGPYTTQATLTPWSGNAALSKQSSFALTQGPGGKPCPPKPAAFNPKLTAGTATPTAGAFSPFSLRLSREDGTQRFAALSATMPPGLLGKLAGIPYCPEGALAAVPAAAGTGQAQLANPSCPPASQIGTVVAGAGAGANPFFVQSGRAYLAGPYKAAPLSLAIVTPALAGPFDLGNVVVRTALRVDPESAQITAVSDPLPQFLDGIPLDLRDIRVNANRPDFTLNPTSCDPLSITATVAGSEGASAVVSDRFQVGDCAKLGFGPKLAITLTGKTRRSGHPALRAVLWASPGDANIASTSVALPHSEFLAQNHIKTICTRVQFAAGPGGGAECPKGSIYGHARAITPLLGAPLEGPVYLRSSTHPLPDLVAALHGQIDVDLVGRIDSKDGGIRTTFAAVPDAPVSKFVLTMAGGKKGLLENSRNLCNSLNRATVLIEAQNAKTADQRPLVRNGCAKKKGKR